MDEYFLHFLWNYQKFITRDLSLVSGEKLIVFKPGTSNPNAGPDFLEAKLKIDAFEWVGSVEIHYQSSDWMAHRHSENPSYDNVILHVVWKHDQEILNQQGQPIPTLSLAQIVDQNLEMEYRRYINQPEVIRCAKWFSTIPQVKKINMLDHALTERLRDKAESVLTLLNANHNDWEETAYQVLARAFGFAVNQGPFLQLAAALPYKIIKKHLNHPLQVQALIFGQAGFLEEVIEEAFHKKLASEYVFLSSKYNLKTSLNRFQWKYSRLRPANFPTVRLAQFCQFLQVNMPLFSCMVDAESLKELDIDDYWQRHFDFGKQLKSGKNNFGLAARNHLIINVKVPLIAAYSRFLDDATLMERATTLLGSLKPEINKITKKWMEIGLVPSNALDSQAMIHQHRNVCERKKCLKCSIGVAILQR